MLVDFNVDSDTPLVVPAVPKEMISVSAEGSKTLVKINSSSHTVIQECMRKAQLLLHQKWKSEDESPATLFGSAIHKALEVFYAGDITARTVPKLETLERMSYGHRVDGENEILALKSFRAFAEKAKLLTPLPETDKRSLQNGAWIMHNYFKAFIDDPYVAYVDESGPFVERPFTLRIHEDETLIVDIFGTIDAVMQHVTNKDIIVCDHKTSSYLNFGGSSYFDRAKPNSQYTGYLMGAREVFKLDTNMFMVSIVEVKAKPKTARGSAPSFPRQLTSRDDNDYAEYKESVVYYARAYLRAIETGVWPIGPVSSCDAYGACSYRMVCSSPKELRENILKSKFKQEKHVNT